MSNMSIFNLLIFSELSISLHIEINSIQVDQNMSCVIQSVSQNVSRVWNSFFVPEIVFVEDFDNLNLMFLKQLFVNFG